MKRRIYASYLTLVFLCLGSLVFGQEKTIVKNGEKAPVFKYADINGKMVSLSDFKGKYVFIDIWATWCGPCKYQLPYLKELEKKMEGKKIVFVSISIDDDRDKWKAYVKDNNLGGVQLIYGGISKFMDAFGSKSVPRFILIDKKGTVVEANLMRPSNQKEIFDYLMGLKGI